MKEEFVSIGDIVVAYYIGENAIDNFLTIDKGSPDDIWFHAKDISSCHVIAKMILAEGKEKIDKKGMRTIIKKGALLCKQNTNKLKTLGNVEFIYTKIQNIKKTDIPGLVTVTNEKIIIC